MATTMVTFPKISKFYSLYTVSRIKSGSTCCHPFVYHIRYVSGDTVPGSTQPQKKRFQSVIPEDTRKWKMLEWRDYQTGKVRVSVDGTFPVLLIPGHSVLPESLDKRRQVQKPPLVIPPPRASSMLPDQDWTNVWPTAQTFKASMIPFPVRQGVIQGNWNDGMPRAKKANIELMKPPNFLHLTPLHIKKHCAAIKKFCTPWPDALTDEESCRKYFPIDVITSDYLADGPNLRDARARHVAIKVKLSDLPLDAHAHYKLLKLAADRYDRKSDILTLSSDRCPMRHQNYGYTIYLLTALHHESWKVEQWEKDETENDMAKFIWSKTTAKKRMEDVLNKMSVSRQIGPRRKKPESAEAIEEYKDALKTLFDQGENTHSLDQYKKSVKRLLLGISS